MKLRNLHFIGRAALVFVTTAAAVIMAGCEQGTTEPVTAPAAVSPAFGPLLRTIRLVDGGQGGLSVSTSGMIGRQGGSLRLGLHELIVPRNAVSGPTTFTMAMLWNGTMTVDLTATDANGAAVTRFPVSLQLKLSYMLLPTAWTNPQRLVVVWLRDDTPFGRLEPVRTTHSPHTRQVVGWIDHFSKFAMGMD